MKTQEWTFIDKSKWPERGPWDHEPDKVQWTDRRTGLPCLAVRARAHWCGYVGVTEGHPAFGREPESVDVSVHGGLTFAGFCQPEEVGEARVCHIPDTGEPDHVFWLGFDCAHFGDYRPATDRRLMDIQQEMTEKFGKHGEVYRTLKYVQRECRQLAAQLDRMGK